MKQPGERLFSPDGGEGHTEVRPGWDRYELSQFRTDADTGAPLQAAMRKRFSSSSSAEEDALCDSFAPLLGSRTPPPPEELQHPCAPLLCCHSSQDSLLSSDSSFTGYRGVLNWIIILLVLTHTHLFLENFIQYGLLIDETRVLGHLMEDDCTWTSVHLLLASNLFSVLALLLQRFQDQEVLSLANTQRLHVANLGALTVCPAAVILWEPTLSTGGAVFSLCVYTILGLKLHSYHEVNHWYRLARSEGEQGDAGAQEDHRGRHTLGDLYYFLLAPTLCYQREFPRTTSVRVSRLLQRLLEMAVVVQIMVGIVQQWIEPIFRRSEISFWSLDGTVKLEQLVVLAAPTHFLWLLLFFLSHSFLNFCAELLRFGDRHFYGDWWNATTLMAFWKNWNIPFQKFCDRHVHGRLQAAGVPSRRAQLLVFLLSAALCEYLVALPLHTCRLWIFLVMVFELLVAVFLGRYFQGNYGNALVWLCLLLGPPLAVTTYFHDHYVCSATADRLITFDNKEGL